LEREKNNIPLSDYEKQKNELTSQLNKIEKQLEQTQKELNSIENLEEVRQSSQAKSEQLKKTAKNTVIGTIYFFILLTL